MEERLVRVERNVLRMLRRQEVIARQNQEMMAMINCIHEQIHNPPSFFGNDFDPMERDQDMSDSVSNVSNVAQTA